jgi:hypothetical protein
MKLKLELGVDRTLDGPDADTLASELAGMNWQEDIFAKLSRDKLNYIQATGTHRDGFIVEYQDGSEVNFFEAPKKLKFDAVKGMFLAYAGGDSSWQTAVQWKRVAIQKNEGRLRTALVLAGVIGLVAFLIFLGIMSFLQKVHQMSP